MDGHRKSSRRHSAELKSQAFQACSEPGASTAAVALAFGINANLVRQWRSGRGLSRAGDDLQVPGMMASGCGALGGGLSGHAHVGPAGRAEPVTAASRRADAALRARDQVQGRQTGEDHLLAGAPEGMEVRRAHRAPERRAAADVRGYRRRGRGRPVGAAGCVPGRVQPADNPGLWAGRHGCSAAANWRVSAQRW